MGFAGKVALVTGAGRGIGKATAEALGSRGVLVIVTEIALDRARQVCRELDVQGVRRRPSAWTYVTAVRSTICSLRLPATMGASTSW